MGRWLGLVVLVALGVFAWCARATANGLPDAVGWVGLAFLALAGVALLMSGRRGRADR